MNSLLYYYNNVQKMAAYRQAKRMQRGALTTQGGFSTTDPALRQTPFTIQCVIRPTKVTSTLQVAFNTKGDSANPRVDLNQSGNIVIYGGGSMLYTKPANLDSIYDIVFVATDSQLSLFVDGTLITSVSYVNTISLYNIGFYFANNSLYFQGDYLLHRHFNYAMSADEVKALDNNGDPMGYVVPKAMRYFPDVSFLGPDGGLIRQSYTWTNSPEDLNFFRYNFKQDILLGQRLKVQITVSDYEAGYVQLDAAFRGEYYGQTDGIRANGTYVFITNALNSTAYTSYGRVWCVDEGQGRKCTVTVDSVEVVGLFAEYLPQNLMGSRKESIGFTHFSTQNPYTFPGGVSKTMYCYLTRRYILGEGLKMRVKVSDYQSGVTTCVLGNVYHTIPSANGEYEFFSVSKLSPDDPASNYAMIYGSGAMTIEVLSIESVTVPTSWLDSAKQLPLSDECMEPLFQSIGGYDMAANGAPEILYNE
jgi:hypothetical protein